MSGPSPIIKWAGGKKQLLDKLVSNMPSSYNRYYEPFIGGAALLLALAPKHATINDVNPQLLNLYRQLRNDTQKVADIIDGLDDGLCTNALYLSRRNQYNGKIAKSELDAECAALFVWLNKHCFNGLYRVNGQGFFNVPWNKKVSGASYEKNNLIAVGRYLSDNDISIKESDFADAVEDTQAGDFIYFDSPYVPVSDTASFTSYAKDGFTEQDHRRLAMLCKKLDKKGIQWMLSNNDVPLVRELYGSYNIESLDVRRSINRDASKRRGVEVIIKNY